MDDEDWSIPVVLTVSRLPEPVYYVESSTDDTVLVGIKVIVQYEKRTVKANGTEKAITEVYVSWWDTIHERCMRASEISFDGNQFAFKRNDATQSGLYRFTPMDLDIYHTKVKQRLLDPADFSSVEEMTKAFLDTIRYNGGF